MIPIDKLVDNEENVYEMTCAAIKRASQITVTGDDDLEDGKEKVVSASLKQILTDKIEYRIEE